jgi:LysM repeat protein
VAVLLRLNSRKLEDPLLVGRKILVPVVRIVQGDKDGGSSLSEEGKAKSARQVTKTYTVEKGDTLFSLAKKKSLSIDELCKLNNMKNSDPLLLGQKIKLP